MKGFIEVTLNDDAPHKAFVRLSTITRVEADSDEFATRVYVFDGARSTTLQVADTYETVVAKIREAT